MDKRTLKQNQEQKKKVPFSESFHHKTVIKTLKVLGRIEEAGSLDHCSLLSVLHPLILPISSYYP
jgi:hypothetical protein